MCYEQVLLLLIQAQAESEICQEEFPIQNLKCQQGSTDIGRSCPSLKSHSGRAERKSHFSSFQTSEGFVLVFLTKCVSWAGEGWMCPSVKAVAAGNRLLPAECVTKTIVFFLSFLSLFRTTPRCSVYWQAGGKETDGVTVGEQSILALIKMGLEIHVWQRNYKLGMPGIKQDKQWPFSVTELHSDVFPLHLKFTVLVSPPAKYESNQWWSWCTV